MKGNYTRVDLIQNYEIRDVCIDCKHIYETYEYDGELDEEFHYILCDKNGCVTCHDDKFSDTKCEQKIVGENFVYDEKGSQEWEQDTRKKLEKFLIENVCPYCENNEGDCIHYLIKTDPVCQRCVQEEMQRILHNSLCSPPIE